MSAGASSWSASAVGTLNMITGQSLAIEATTDPESPILEAFYAGYDAAFVLPNEKETLQGFKDCLALNAGDAYRRLSARYGAFREVILVAVDPASGERVGAANFIACPLARSAPVLGVNLNYIFTDAAQRRRGYFKRLLASIGEIAAAFFEPGAQALPTLIFIEQNDPLRMSAEDYRRDTAFTGLDQMTRIRIWAGLGARLVDFPYVQPPLSPTLQPDENLLYAVLGAIGETLDACLLHDHLERFFGISVLKGAPCRESRVASRQLRVLARRCKAGEVIPLLDPIAALESRRTVQ